MDNNTAAIPHGEARCATPPWRAQYAQPPHWLRSIWRSHLAAYLQLIHRLDQILCGIGMHRVNLISGPDEAHERTLTITRRLGSERVTLDVPGTSFDDHQCITLSPESLGIEGVRYDMITCQVSESVGPRT